MDLPRREIIDTAMGQLGFGAVVYGFNYDPANFTCNAWEPDCGTKEAGKFEEFISVRHTVCSFYPLLIQLRDVI